MPATESTWRSQDRLNVVFSVTGLVLFGATIWMFYQDHMRSWKKIQPVAVMADQRMNRWRKEQINNDKFKAKEIELNGKLEAAQAAPIPVAVVEEVVRLVKAHGDPTEGLQAALNELTALPTEIEKKQAELAAAEKQGDAKLQEKLTKEVADLESQFKERTRYNRTSLWGIVGKVTDLARTAKNRENNKSQERKFESAQWDAAKAKVDLGVRDNLPPAEMAKLQDGASERQHKVEALTEAYQNLATHRKALEVHLKTLTAGVDAAVKAIEENNSGVNRLETAFVDRRETYFVWTPVIGPISIPLPGKQWLNFPIIDAFGSRRKIDNRWSTDLEQNLNHADVRRFDRCTTCHQMIGKSAPGQPTTQAYLPERTVEFLLMPPTKELVKESESLKELPKQLETLFGLRLADYGVVEDDAVTIRLVQPESSGAKALPAETAAGNKPTSVALLREEIARLCEVKRSISDEEVAPGLIVGDVIEAVEDVEAFFPDRVAATLVDLGRQRAGGAEPKPIKLRVRRGLPMVYTSHPRLDLFVSDNSPHSIGKFACTVCHEGQGSATDFKWASHTPDDPGQGEHWHKNYGWFDNAHWIYPMYPKRFAESACLKCHHNVVELEPSARFPESAAPKVTHGYHLILKYGCYGCHEVKGFDGPTRRIGPDMRLEPSFFAVAQELLFKVSGDGKVAAEVTSLAKELVQYPDEDATRTRLRKTIEDDAASESPQLPPEASRLANMLKDIEAPGKLRKPGPSLRFLTSKLDFENSPEAGTFLYDWLKKPGNFRPTTRMPQFFGLWKHLENAEGHMEDHLAPKFEPLEIRSIMAYLAQYDQKFEPLTPMKVDEAADAARGKQQFETRGCLACHTHKDFPEAPKYRKASDIVQGPDLSGVGSKFTGATGQSWLYSWIKEPTKYHVRTVMPTLFLNPETNADGKTFDPAADIVAYLSGSKAEDWTPALEGSPKFDQLDKEAAEALGVLVFDNVQEAAFRTAAENYSKYGIPEDMKAEFKGAEQELMVPRAAYEAKTELTDRQKLVYLGRRTISRYGCFGCHDIPGFEDAKPIGTGLADWGRKDPAKLAFEHITHFVEREKASEKKNRKHQLSVEDENREAFFEESLIAGHRAGFIDQKLHQPRSYDFDKTANKKYSERLRMPQFPFTPEDRENVSGFVLGLVAEPPREKYLYRPDARQAAIQEGKVVLEKFNCAGCHILQMEEWQVSYAPGEIPRRSSGKANFPFLASNLTAKELAAHTQVDGRGLLHARLSGLPTIDKGDARPVLQELQDGQKEVLDDEAIAKPNNVIQSFTLYQPTIIEGTQFASGEVVTVTGRMIDAKLPAWGGDLTRYLTTRVLEIEREANPNAPGTEVYGWLPPPLVGEGRKVQTAWLHDFLLNPYPIRPATFLRMPKFNMSTDEASSLVNYFAAVDNASFPYEFATRRQPAVLAAKENAYREKIGEPILPADSDHTARFDAAVNIVVDGNYCVKCHIVGDFAPKGSDRAKAPNLGEIYRRMRPDYLRDWIADPARILPYTAMPVNIKFNKENPAEDGVSQDLFKGNSEQQLDGLVDLLMNYDLFSRGRFSVKPLIKTPPPMPAADAKSDGKDAAKDDDK